MVGEVPCLIHTTVMSLHSHQLPLHFRFRFSFRYPLEDSSPSAAYVNDNYNDNGNVYKVYL